MLEDFIKANNLQAKILPYAAKGSLVKCRFFSSNSGDLLLVFFAKDKISEEKVKTTLNTDLVKPMESSKAEEAAGYSFEFMPPISIYGVKVVLDSKPAKAEKLRCLVEEQKTLLISPNEILESNDDSTVADITL